ncbi:hypothetical protein [Staphylococcus aureus]
MENLMLYVCWVLMSMVFMFINIHSIIHKKLHIFLNSNKYLQIYLLFNS